MTNRELHERAKRAIPGGVSSPVRAFGAVGGTPLFIESARGSRIRDVEGRELIDCVGSWGPLILGHRHPEVEEAVIAAARRGTTYGAPTEAEIELAELIRSRMPAVERVRLTSSGTEACMSAARLARAFTGRDRIIKFEGCYHGHADSFLVKSGSGALTFGVPSSPGVPAALAGLTHAVPFNDLDAVADHFERLGREIAAIFVEPVVGNMGVVPPAPGFLEGLRDLCDRHGALLVFDEVITGFRVARGGAQERYGIRPDLTVLGKIAGGGLPLAAFGGRAEVMDELAPEGPVYQAGTLSGNPLATAAALVVLRRLRDPDVYRQLDEISAALEAGLRHEDVTVQRVGSMLTVFFRGAPVRNVEDARASDLDRYGAFFRHLLAHGVYVAPSQFEAFFVSTAHGPGEVERTVEAAQEFLAG
jgi:glutamate-1-semialdehyde 2,1-aminomutase